MWILSSYDEDRQDTPIICVIIINIRIFIWMWQYYSQRQLPAGSWNQKSLMPETLTDQVFGCPIAVLFLQWNIICQRIPRCQIIHVLRLTVSWDCWSYTNKPDTTLHRMLGKINIVSLATPVFMYFIAFFTH